MRIWYNTFILFIKSTIINHYIINNMNLGGLDFNNATAEDICMLIDNTLSGNN